LRASPTVSLDNDNCIFIVFVCSQRRVLVQMLRCMITSRSYLIDFMQLRMPTLVSHQLIL